MTEIFHRLFIFEMANNHQGSVEHGKKIIDAMADIAKRHKLRAAVKFQFRDLPTFIHPDFAGDTKAKHISRFLSTELSKDQFKELVEYTMKKGLHAIATPFDETSVDLCMDLGIEVIKIASCSALDWPLIEKIASANMPVIASTGGVDIADIDKVVTFFAHRKVPLALLHCVGVYPTPNKLLNMSVVGRFIKRYPELIIGYSGHEAPNALLPVALAIAQGAQVLERHVGVETDTIKLNAYSMNPDQTEIWVQAALAAWEIQGSQDKYISQEEKDSLHSLARGVYAKRPIKKGKKIERDDVYFAMPLQDNQITSGEFGSIRQTFIAEKDYAEDQPVSGKPTIDEILIARALVHEAKGMLNEAGIAVTEAAEIELSHHYGLDRFKEVGAIIVNLYNREYGKKLIIMVPGQRHPQHRHEKKEEMFELLWGDIEVHLEGETVNLKPGEQLLIKRNSWHSFYTKGGAIFEEISTTHYRSDSFYEDLEISKLDPMERKTVIRDYGNF